MNAQKTLMGFLLVLALVGRALGQSPAASYTANETRRAEFSSALGADKDRVRAKWFGSALLA